MFRESKEKGVLGPAWDSGKQQTQFCSALPVRTDVTKGQKGVTRAPGGSGWVEKPHKAVVNLGVSKHHGTRWSYSDEAQPSQKTSASPWNL